MAVLLRKPDWESLRLAMFEARPVKMSAASFVELHVVLLRRFGLVGVSPADELMRLLEVHVVEVDLRQADLAVEAFTRFGKGRHPAALNFGDCFSYALAKALGEPLLFKGEDFSRTDVIVASSL